LAVGDARDGGDDVIFRRVLHCEARHAFAEPKAYDPVGHVEDIDQIVADHKQGVAFISEAFDQSEHLCRLLDAERSGRLIEDQQLWIAEKRAGDRNRLALSTGQRGDRRAQILDLDRKARQQAYGDLFRVERSQESPGSSLLAQKQIRDDVEIVATTSPSSTAMLTSLNARTAP
jgi:hypothetical protein